MIIKKSEHREFVKNFDLSSALKAKLLLTIGDSFEVCDDVGMLIEFLCQITDPLYLSINSLEFDRLHTACMEWAYIDTSTGNQLIKIKRVSRRNLHWYPFVSFSSSFFCKFGRFLNSFHIVCVNMHAMYIQLVLYIKYSALKRRRFYRLWTV